MLMVISPAKDLAMQRQAPVEERTEPAMLADAKQLIDICRDLTPVDIAKLMKLSDKLAGLNAARFADWQLPFTRDNASPALFAFNGDVYQGLDASSLTPEDLKFAQQHLRILSGLYGVLRPLDLMQAYRLEMGTRLKNPAGETLYAFWQDRISEQLNQQLDELGSELLLNLASQEYFKAVKPKALQAKVLNVQFKDCKNGQYKVISFYAKKARGMMARYVITNRVKTAEQLQSFHSGGYYFSQQESSASELVFLRDEVA
ncbi:peroxide stress protein YaaA [Alkalimonas sp.]|uniref:peroxide stress protein YaaA n=1 Tax=Alkalimonas sp. TaxID=1872453 RepID=UPI00263B35B9|nr:peroxide stress protein YaaA [Alkalimonas sp.]MCC5826080.1 peroxide stress protein YaaA [Alkalimonas sp.]